MDGQLLAHRFPKSIVTMEVTHIVLNCLQIFAYSIGNVIPTAYETDNIING